MKEPKAPPRFALTLIFSFIVMGIFIITMTLVGGFILILNHAGVKFDFDSSAPIVPSIVLALTSIIVGTFVSTIISRIPLKPVNKLISGLNRLASGDYEAKLEVSKNPVVGEVTNSFNLLADELKNTELLRSDFVNNFSHEFKTPIVSIRGFAKLLQKDNLSEQQKKEYLDIILEESNRLADMATNVLNLSKVESQTILTDIAAFNLSEQIRKCILLLEKKWEIKKLNMSVDFGEFQICANEELLKQVWINLIDNAIKFSPEYGEVGIAITDQQNIISISITNYGSEIKEDEIKRIFNKYWQGETSHASEGTGIGLSIAKRIIELHKGSISVNSSSKKTIFTIILPC